MAIRLITGRWRAQKVVLGLICVEFALTVAILALFGIAAPDLYRTKLWQDGGDNGFNSSPNKVTLSYANHRPVETPLVWSQFITNFNIIISVLSMFLLLVKSVMFVLHTFMPLISLFVHALLLGLYSYSIHAQTAPDTIDPEHPANGPPWYITKSCDVTRDKSLVGFCQQAKGSFFLTVFMLAIFAIHIVLALWSICFWKKAGSDTESTAGLTKGSPQSDITTEEKWSMHDYPVSLGTTGGMKSPMTPRTVAFKTLGGHKDLPLRNGA